MLTENFSAASKYNLLTSDSSAYLNTHILNPAFISILYVGSMENSESCHVLISTSLSS